MKKKVLSLAGLWLALVLLVFVYTDREENTWRYGADALDRILITQQQAQENEAQAALAMQAEREAAAKRREDAQWDRKETYGGAPITRRAQEDAPGLNLMWGRYEVIVDSAAVRQNLRVVSAGRQAFIKGGEAALDGAQGETAIAFELTDAAQQVMIACDAPEQIAAVTVRRVQQRVFSPDLAAYALLLGAVLSVLLMLSWDQTPRGRERRRDALMIVFAAAFAGMPLLWQGIYGGHDLHFHLNRIEGIAGALRAGQFPARIHSTTLLGYGYAAPQFYPELFLYLPALMRNLGVSLAACVRVSGMMINLLAALSAYACGRRLFEDRRVALGASVLYTLCLYRLVNLYVRASIGESLAMIFFPLLLAALPDVLTGDERRWPLLALSMTGIAMSHLLSTLFAVLFCALAALVCAKKLITQPRRILAILKAAAVTALCSLWFFVPMLTYTMAAGINTSVALDSYEHVMKLGAYLIGFPGDHAGIPDSAKDFAYTVGVVPGYAVMIGCALFVLRRYMQGGRARREDKTAGVLLCFGGAALLLATELFPWAWACNLPRPYSTFFKQIQYPWRLVGVGAPMLCMAAAWGYMMDEKRRAQMLGVIVLLSCLLGGYTMQSFVQQNAPVLYADSFCDTRIGQFEYLYYGTEKASLAPGEIVAGKTDNYAVADVDKQGTNLRFTLDIPESCAYVDVPLMYYPGYKATVNGQACRVSLGENNVIRLYGVGMGTGLDVRVWFESPRMWLAAQGASAVGAALLALSLMGMKKTKRRRGA